MKKIILLFFIFLAIQSCNSNSDPEYFGTIRPVHPVDEVWINGGSEPQSLDPNKAGGEIEQTLLDNMFVRLTQTNPKTGDPVPDLAESWDISKDGLEYTFHLRHDAKWSDGVPITASDVEYSWKRFIDPKTGALMSSLTDNIENASEFRSGKKSVDMVSVRAKDDHTLWVKLTAPVTYFLGVIDYVAFAPIPKHLIEKLKVRGLEDQWSKPENIIVSGPFKIIEDRFKQFKIFEKNPTYYHADKVKIRRVKTIEIEDYNADMNAYKTGQHDWSCCNNVQPEEIVFLKSKKDFAIAPYFSTYFLMSNTLKPPLDQALVRRALSLAIDRKSIVENITRAGQQPTRDFVPVGTEGYPGIQSEIYNPEEAKKLLARAGYPDGKGFPKMSLKYNTADVHKHIAEAIQEMWKKNLNIDLELANEEWAVFMEDQKSGNYQMMRRSWIGDYLDPHSFLSMLITGSSTNRSGWHDTEFDRLIETSNRELNKEKRFEYFKKAEKILAEEQPYIPLYFFTMPYLKKPFLKGFWPNLQDRHPWKYMWIDDRWTKGKPNPVEIPDEPWL